MREGGWEGGRKEGRKGGKEGFRHEGPTQCSGPGMVMHISICQWLLAFILQ